MICNWNTGSWRNWHLNQIALISISVVSTCFKGRHCINRRLKRPGGQQPQEQGVGGRTGEGCKRSWLLCVGLLPGPGEARGTMPTRFLRARELTLPGDWSQVTLGSHASFQTSPHGGVFKLASVAMTQNFVLNYHDCFWGPGIINILYFNCLRLFWHISLIRIKSLFCF